jgi:hypothetical protein
MTEQKPGTIKSVLSVPGTLIGCFLYDKSLQVHFPSQFSLRHDRYLHIHILLRIPK